MHYQFNRGSEVLPSYPPISIGIQRIASQTALFAIKENFAPWRASALESLGQLRECTENNWDGRGANALDCTSLNNAIGIVCILSEIEGIEPPFITLSPDGNVALCWDDSNVMMDVEVVNDVCLRYAYVNRKTGVEKEGETLQLLEIAELLTNI